MNSVLFIWHSSELLGGVQTWLNYLLPGLKERGWKVCLGLLSGECYDVDAYTSVHPFDKIIPIVASNQTEFDRVFAIKSVILDYAPDLVVNVHVYDAFRAAAELKNECLIDFKFIAAVHLTHPAYLNDLIANKDCIDGAIVVNRLTERLLVNHVGLERSRVFFAALGVHIPMPTKKAVNKIGCSLHILHAGRLDNEQKRIFDIPFILKAAVEKKPNIHLTIAGGGPDEARLKEMFSDLDLVNYVTFRGVLSPAKIFDAYRASDILLVTSDMETGPLVALEAFANKTTVITSDFIGRKAEGAFIHNENCLVFPIGDIEKAAACIFDLSAGDDFNTRLQENAFKTVTKNYSHNQSIEHWANIFNIIINTPTKIGLCKILPQDNFNYVGFRRKDGVLEWPYTASPGQLTDEDFIVLASINDNLSLIV